MLGMVVSHINPRGSTPGNMKDFGGLQDGITHWDSEESQVLFGRLDGLDALVAILDIEVADPHPRLYEINSFQMLEFQPLVERR